MYAKQLAEGYKVIARMMDYCDGCDKELKCTTYCAEAQKVRDKDEH